MASIIYTTMLLVLLGLTSLSIATLAQTSPQIVTTAINYDDPRTQNLKWEVYEPGEKQWHVFDNNALNTPVCVIESPSVQGICPQCNSTFIRKVLERDNRTEQTMPSPFTLSADFSLNSPNYPFIPGIYCMAINNTIVGICRNVVTSKSFVNNTGCNYTFSQTIRGNVSGFDYNVFEDGRIIARLGVASQRVQVNLTGFNCTTTVCYSTITIQIPNAYKFDLVTSFPTAWGGRLFVPSPYLRLRCT